MRGNFDDLYLKVTQFNMAGAIDTLPSGQCVSDSFDLISRTYLRKMNAVSVVTADLFVNLNVTYYVIVLVLSSRSFCYCN